MKDQRLIHEIQHGKYLIEHGAGEIWNWESPAGKIRWKRRVEMLNCSISQKANVLEIGCGTGYYSKELGKLPAFITAIDISPDLIEIAKKENQFENVIFKVENAYDMRFTSNTFDNILGSSVLHHLEINKALAEIYRVLKPGGTIGFTEPNMLNPQIAFQKNIPYLKKLAGDSPDETAFFRWRLSRQLKDHGFTNISIKPFDYLHPATPKSIINIISKIGLWVEKIPVLKEFSGSLYIIAKKPAE